MIAQEKEQADNILKNDKTDDRSDDRSTKGVLQKEKLEGLINSLGKMSDNKEGADGKGKLSTGNLGNGIMSDIESKL